MQEKTDDGGIFQSLFLADSGLPAEAGSLTEELTRICASDHDEKFLNSDKGLETTEQVGHLWFHARLVSLPFLYAILK